MKEKIGQIIIKTYLFLLKGVFLFNDVFGGTVLVVHKNWDTRIFPTVFPFEKI